MSENSVATVWLIWLQILLMAAEIKVVKESAQAYGLLGLALTVNGWLLRQR